MTLLLTPVENGGITVIPLLLPVFFIFDLMRNALFERHCLDRQILHRYKIVSIFTLAWLAAYSTINILGRMNIRSAIDILSSNSYYSYVPILCVSLLAGMSLCVVSQNSGENNSNIYKKIVITVLAMFALLGVFSSAVVNKNITVADSEFAGFASAIKKVISIDRFALFKISPETSASIQKFNGVANIEILFSSRIDQCSAQYEIIKTTPYVVNATSKDCYPALIRPGSSYNFYSFKNKIYGVLHWQSPFDPLRSDYVYLITADTLEDAMAQVADKTRQQVYDTDQGRFAPPSNKISLIVEGYKGFNLIASDGLVYAIPQGEGDFNAQRALSGGYTRAYVSKDEESVKQKIDSNFRFSE